MRTIPRLRFGQLPTPVEHLQRLSAEFRGIRVLVKRDDLTGLAFGGNKTRKLEFLVAEAQANGAKTLITAGAAQSNHCRQTAAAAARFGFQCILVLSGLPENPPTGNILLDTLFGAEIVWTTLEQREETLQKVFESAWERGQRPYLVPYGGSNPVGATAYLFAHKELMDQEIEPDWIFFPSSSGGTQAGLVLGQHTFHFTGKIVGISVDQPASWLCQRVAELARETAEFLEIRSNIQAGDVLVSDEYIGAGYGIAGEREIEAIRLFARLEGLLLDPVYTGRAAAGMLDYIRAGKIRSGETVLFWHTGGTPALFAGRYRDLLLSS